MGCICYIDASGQRRCFYEKERKIIIEEKDDKISEHTNKERKEDYNQIEYPIEKPKEKKSRTIITKINIKNQRLKEFLNKINIQGLKDDTNDYSYNDLKNLEQEQLKIVIQEKQKELENEINKIFTFKMIKDTDIDTIIRNEYTDSMIKKKISAIAREIEKDKEKYKFKNLKIMLVGRKGIGKTDLINYVFESEENVEKKKLEDLTEYTCEKYPFLKFVEYRGIGFDHNSNPELIGTKICNYIKNLQSHNYNEFIHCIWYCITETKFEAPEIAVLKKLKSSYQNDNVLPVIVVYTKTESHEEANLMEQHIKNQNIDTVFIKTLAKSYEMPNGKIQETFGRKELLDATLDKCTKSLQGDLINLMSKNIAHEIQEEMINDNKKILKDIKEKIVDDFINKFVQVLEDGDLIDYIINIIIDNLFAFYGIKITNKSFNYLNKSEFINDIKSKISSYKSNVKRMIEPKVEEKAKIFLDEQAKIEIEKGNMQINNKRKLSEFKKTIKIFLKKNFYYISQRLMISLLLENIFISFFDDYAKKLDKKIKNILDIKNNKDIRILMANTFLTKLKDFGDNCDIKIEIKKIDNNNPHLPEQREIENDEEKQNNNNLITNSFNLVPDENNDIKKKNDVNDNNMNNEFVENKNWFPFERSRKWKYIKDKSSLDEFLQNLVYQDSYFNLETDDQIFASLKDYIKKNLIIFLNQKKLEFIRNIECNYLKKKFPFEKKIIQKIIEKEKISSIFDEKIKNEIEIINSKINEIKIDYMTIIIMGRSGLGKSELINCLLKDNKAEVGVGFRVTLNNTVYRGDNNLSFLRLIDTRGTELNEEIGLEQIKKNAIEMIDKMKLEANNSMDFNKNIQCIYYCVKGASLEESEIKTIEEIKNNKDSIPLIVIFTKGVNMGDINSMRNIITSRLNVPFINILAKDMNGQERYGLNNLLQLTLDVCQKAKKGNIFKAIKKKICNKIQKNLEKKNENIKYNISNNMLQKLNNFKKVVDENELFGVIYNYLEIAFVEYMKSEQNENLFLKEESKEELKSAKLINDYIKEFIESYKKRSKEIVEPSLENGSLEFLDMQVKKEKQLSESIQIENKNNRETFKKIIRDFLNSNFYYISQKYLIYRFLSDLSEPFSEELENKLNVIVKTNLENNNTEKLIEFSYDKIFNTFRQTIFLNAQNGKIYDEREDGDDYNLNHNNFNNNYFNNNNNYQSGLDSQKSENKNDLECPHPYPSF